MGFEHWEVEFGKIRAGKWHWNPFLQDPLLTVRRQSVFHNVTYAF